MKKILLCDGREFAWEKGDLHTNFGLLKEDDIKSHGIIESNKGKTFFVLDAEFLDKVGFMKRGPQMPFAKDVAVILFYSGVGKESKVLDSGVGSGFLTASLARIAKSVVSYEIKEDVAKLAEKNMEFLGIKNVMIKNKDIYEGIEETDLDLITLDLPEPWRVLEHACKALKNSGALVTYLPSIVQVKELVENARTKGFFVVKTIEILEREWVVNDKIVRPSHEMYGHTAFLTFLRKL